MVPGTYTLSEIEAPDNYNLVTTTWTVTVEADGSYTITDNSENTSCEYTSSLTDVFEIENIAKTRTLTISKTVTGNVGDKSKDFDFTLVLTKDSTNYTDDLVANTETLKANTSGTYSFNLKDGESITITVPYGYTYTVDESDYSSEGYTTTITSGNKSDVIVKDSSVSFENNKEVRIETGVDTGTPIYPIVLLGIIGLCFISLIVIFFRRKKLY